MQLIALMVSTTNYYYLLVPDVAKQQLQQAREQYEIADQSI